MSRPHPFEIAFGAQAEGWFGTLKTAGEVELSDLGTFARLDAIRPIVDQLQPEGGAPEAIEEYVRLLYAGYHFWAAGCRTVPVTRKGWLEMLDRPVPWPEPNLTGSAYYQFPERWFWAQLDRDRPHEPLDGIFVAGSRSPRPAGWLMLAVLGLRPQRGGFSQISVLATPDDLVAARGAAGRSPFAPSMEGGGSAGFRSITTVAELLLAARCALAAAT